MHLQAELSLLSEPEMAPNPQLNHVLFQIFSHRIKEQRYKGTVIICSLTCLRFFELPWKATARALGKKQTLPI